MHAHCFFVMALPYIVFEDSLNIAQAEKRLRNKLLAEKISADPEFKSVYKVVPGSILDITYPD